MIEVRPYTDSWIGAVRAFNERLDRGNAPKEFRFPESPVPEWLPPSPGSRLYQAYYLATDGDTVRGGYILKPQEFHAGGETRHVAHYRLPLSEGIVDKKYTMTGVLMLRDALAREPLLFALGMGGQDKPLPRMLRSMGWSLADVPFYFRVVHASPFLRNIQTLRSSPLRRAAAAFAAYSGLGAAGNMLIRAARRPRVAKAYRSEPFEGFGGWADGIWDRCAGQHAFAAVRDAGILNLLYPAQARRFLGLRVMHGEETCGWVILLDTQMRAHRHFGDMRVATIVDGLAVAEHTGAVVAAATQFLESRGADIIISNQSSRLWRDALTGAGFFEAPSNYVLALSKAAAALLPPIPEQLGQFHINRGDGDGPIHL